MMPASILLAAALNQAAPVTVVDIEHATLTEVNDAKALASTHGWWLELGNELVLAGLNKSDEQHLGLPLQARFESVDAARLRVIGRGCAEPIQFGQEIASSGRWQLRLVDPGQPLPDDDAHLTIRAFEPNQVLAQRHRLSTAARAKAAADPAVQAVVDSIDSARWFADVSTLASFDRSSYATTSLAQARDWIAGQMQTIGLTASTPNFNMSSPSGTITRQNVLGVWTGTSLPDEWVIVGAHYDSRTTNINTTLNTPGAEDNASGCAGVLELARALVPRQPTRTVLFMCYAGEEQNLLGSAAHVQSLNSGGQLTKVQAVVIMDMIGYSADANLQALYETSATYLSYAQRFGAAATTYVPALDVVYSTNPFGSDHMPYLNAGRQTLLAIENDWDIYPHYHRSTDTPANMGANAAAMGSAILKTNAAVLAELVGLPPAAEFADGFESPAR
ncbi:M28 family metallopeptidase [Ahniella affigens]|nr:M28 family metallopeptidase [Ahniella affigens]